MNIKNRVRLDRLLKNSNKEKEESRGSGLEISVYLQVIDFQKKDT